MQRSRCQRRKKEMYLLVSRAECSGYLEKKASVVHGSSEIREVCVTEGNARPSVAHQASFVCVLSSLPWRFQHSRNASICAGAERISRFSWTELL